MGWACFRGDLSHHGCCVMVCVLVGVCLLLLLQVLNYFASLDIPVLELFGQSESTGPHTSNFSYAWKIGSIGRDVRRPPSLPSLPWHACGMRSLINAASLAVCLSVCRWWS